MLALLIAVTAQPALPSWSVIDRIERRVALPRGAKPLAAYARHYAMDAPDIVTAVYLIPVPFRATRADECEELTADLRSRPCDPAEIARMNREAARAASREAKAGQRRRYGRIDDMPYINDGGCLQVTVRYRMSTDRVLSVACNGRA